MNPRLLIIAILCVVLALPAHAAITSYSDLMTKFRDPATLDKEIPDVVRGNLGTNHWTIIIIGVRVEYYWAETLNGHVVRTGRGRRYSPPHTAMLLSDKLALDNIFVSSNRRSAFMSALRTGKLQIMYLSAGQGIGTTLGLGAANLGLLGSGPAPGTKKVGDVCAHGGECITANCVGAGMGPPWTYLCSCDPYKYATSGPQCQSPVVIPAGGAQAGTVCKHGGECASGSCVGTGMGPPWVYQCSCESFKYSTTGPLCK